MLFSQVFGHSNLYVHSPEWFRVFESGFEKKNFQASNKAHAGAKNPYFTISQKLRVIGRNGFQF